MKQQITHGLLALSILSITAHVSAIEKFSGTLMDDIYFPNGVLLENVESSSAGKAEVTLEGTGSLTIGNQSGGGFPRISVAGGTKISSNRSDTTSTWAGQFTSPGSTKKPNSGDVSFSGGNHTGNTPEPIVTFTWGLSDETFTYSPAARVVLPVNAPDGQKLWVAYPGSGDAWSIQDGDFCIVEGSLCYFETGSVDSVTLVKESFGSCPTTNIENGSMGGTPNCIISCDRGYILGDEANSCIIAGDLSDNPDESLTSQTNDVNNYSGTDENIVLPEKEYNFMPGHFRYRDSGRRGKNLLDEESLSGEELKAAKHTNTSFLSRNPRTAKEQLNKDTGKKSETDKMAEEESFASYLIQMRNTFVNEKTRDEVVALSQSSSDEAATAEENKNLHASAGKLLPSTGPSIFFIIAIAGFLLMMFSGVRRN